MIEEKEIWNSIIPKSTSVLQYLIDTELEFYYVNLLFVFRVAPRENHKVEEIINWAENREWGKINRIDKFYLQMRINHYLVSIYSVLDYLEEFIDQNNIVDYEFITNYNKIKNKIREGRNQVVHDNVPTLYFDDYEQINDICHADVAKIAKSESYIKIDIEFEETDRMDLNVFVQNTYFDTKKLIEEINDNILEESDDFR